MDLDQANIAASLRRVITGVNEKGDATIIIDGPPAETLERGVIGLYEYWNDEGEPMARHDVTDRAKGAVSLEPPAGGIRVRAFSIAPFSSDVSEEEKLASLNDSFDSMDGNSSRGSIGKHPGMHETKTIDIVTIIRGRVKLIMEDGERILGPGDVVVQRGTNHAWEAVGDEPAVGVGVLIDREFAD